MDSTARPAHGAVRQTRGFLWVVSLALLALWFYLRFYVTEERMWDFLLLLSILAQVCLQVIDRRPSGR
jgi:hypothetical protein